MTYYMYNAKLIDTLTWLRNRPPIKWVAWIEFTFVVIYSVGAVWALAAQQYIAACMLLAIEIMYIFGGSYSAHKRMLNRASKVFYSTISLEDYHILLHDGDGRLMKIIQYNAIERCEQLMMRESIQPIYNARFKPVREEVLFICLYLDFRKIEEYDYVEEYREDPMVILFPFYRSAWNELVEKIPERCKGREETN